MISSRAFLATPHHPGPLLPSPSPRPGEEGEKRKTCDRPPRTLRPASNQLRFLAPSLPVGGRAMGERGLGE